MNTDQPTMAFTTDRDLLLAARTGGLADAPLAELAALDAGKLFAELAEDDRRRAFWLNVYNALALIALRNAPVDLTHRATRMKHYALKRWSIGGEPVSLNLIEHGLLRDSRPWWGLGYVRDPFPNNFERRFRVPLDPRIHFALNCGAVSCPPIEYYNSDILDTQLDIAARAFLEDSTHYDEATNTVHVTPLFQWYRNDLGGPSGTLRMLRHYGILPSTARPLLRYTAYNWSTLTLSNT